MEHKFTPEVCTDTPAVPAKPGEGGAPDTPEVPAVPARYEGTVTIRMPTYDERLDLTEAGGDLGDLGNMTTPERVKLMRLLAKWTRERLVVVDIRRKSDGYKFDSWEVLQHETDIVNSLILEIGLKLIGRFSVGGNPS